MDPDVGHTIKWALFLGTLFIIMADVLLQVFRASPLFIAIVDIYVGVMVFIIILTVVMFR